jgi:hypothetical protein
MSSSHLASVSKVRNIRYFNYIKHSMVCIKLL